MEMTVTMLDPKKQTFSLTGTCPHCLSKAVFMIVTSPHVETIDDDKGIYRHVAAMQCQGCREHILGIVKEESVGKFFYERHYPIGLPNDSAPAEIPPAIADDFREAIRCRWAKATKAAVAMCGRALEASCIDLGADADKRILDQIDSLASKGKITAPLKAMAHQIRLGRNRGAHPPKDDDLADLQPEHADAIIEFLGEFFHHVYVMPAKCQCRLKIPQFAPVEFSPVPPVENSPGTQKIVAMPRMQKQGVSFRIRGKFDIISFPSFRFALSLAGCPGWQPTSFPVVPPSV